MRVKSNGFVVVQLEAALWRSGANNELRQT